mmetsp:Transcript_43544/g.81808  ORF Transcript_43544/g.81808 Transcript_43544/m.81808 type:complete len:574 (+) Transcript_43544:56-1777(+)
MPSISSSTRVRIKGLTGRPELNGRVGKALRFVKDKGRWQVRLDGEADDSSLALKEDNLQPLKKYGEALAKSIVSARERAGEAEKPLRLLHILAATDFELCLEFASLSAGGDAPLEVVLIGADFPETYPSKELQAVSDWPEPAVKMSVFRGAYEEFIESPSFAASGGAADAAVILHPAASSMGPLEGGFFTWVETLYALAVAGDTLGICLGVEPFVDGEFYGDGVLNEMVIRSCGFDITAPTEWNPHGTKVSEHPSCAWRLWACSLAFRWPGGRSSAPDDLEAFTWKGYYNARRVQCKLPRFRFRAPYPDWRPSELDDLQKQFEKDLEVAKDARDDPEAQQRFQKQEQDRQEKGALAVTGWVSRTVQAAYTKGGEQPPIVAAVAGAVAAAEEFADKSFRESRPPPKMMYIIPVATSEVAAKAAMSAEGGGPGAAAVAIVAVVLFESLASEALWRGQGAVGSEAIGYAVTTAFEREKIEFSGGVASTIGSRVMEFYSLHCGRPEPLIETLEEAFRDLLEGVCECADVGDGPEGRRAITQAMLDNMDMSIPARGGFEATLDISRKMHMAPMRVKPA